MRKARCPTRGKASNILPPRVGVFTASPIKREHSHPSQREGSINGPEEPFCKTLSSAGSEHSGKQAERQISSRFRGHSWPRILASGETEAWPLALNSRKETAPQVLGLNPAATGVPSQRVWGAGRGKYRHKNKCWEPRSRGHRDTRSPPGWRRAAHPRGRVSRAGRSSQPSALCVSSLKDSQPAARCGCQAEGLTPEVP